MTELETCPCEDAMRPIDADPNVRLLSLIASDAPRMHLLRRVRDLNLPDCWIGAGFVRLDDLFALALRPTPSFETGKRIVFQTRVREKRWLERWPLLFLSKEFIMRMPQ